MNLTQVDAHFLPEIAGVGSAEKLEKRPVFKCRLLDNCHSALYIYPT